MMLARLVLMAAVTVMAVGTGMAATVTGEAALAAIREAMAAAGAPPPTMAAPLRALPDCTHTPVIAPRGGDWAVVELSCRTPVWTRVLRTGAPSGATVAAVGDTTETSNVATHGDAAGAMVATLQRPVPRGHRITADDLVMVPLQSVDKAQAITEPERALGRRLRRALGPGQPLLERHLDPAQDIEPGQRVTLMLDIGAISIRQEGTALSGGRAGDLLRLQMASDRGPVEAMILGPGLARIAR